VRHWGHERPISRLMFVRRPNLSNLPSLTTRRWSPASCKACYVRLQPSLPTVPSASRTASSGYLSSIGGLEAMPFSGYDSMKRAIVPVIYSITQMDFSDPRSHPERTLRTDRNHWWRSYPFDAADGLDRQGSRTSILCRNDVATKSKASYGLMMRGLFLVCFVTRPARVVLTR
jgi:hypothetical protein